MAKKSTKQVGLTEWIRTSLVRASRAHFLYLFVYAVVLVAYDAARVITPDIVMQRWIAAAGLLIVSAAVWYMAHNQKNDLPTYKRLLFTLVVFDTAFAAFNVYTQRGMASRAVLLFVIPIILSAILLSRPAIFATAALASAAYITAAVMYFTLNFNEGYKSELYGEVGFYCVMFFVIATLLSVLVRFGSADNT